MRQLFPEPELCEYVWNHLASCLIGDTALNQCLHYLKKREEHSCVENNVFKIINKF